MASKSNLVKITLFVISILVCIIGIVKVSERTETNKRLLDEEQEKTSELKNIKDSYYQHKIDVQEKAYQVALDSDETLIHNFAVYDGNLKLLSNLSERFFETFFTWDNSEDYRNRSELLNQIISEELKNNQMIFDEGKDTTGGDYIETTGLRSEYLTSEVFSLDEGNEDISEALVKVTYSSWYGNKKQEAGTSTVYYSIELDKRDSKIVNVEKVFSEN